MSHMSQYDAYKKVDVETASQGKLVVMLFNGAIQRAEEAKRQLEKGKLDKAHNNLIRAQEIVTELRTALDVNTGEIARNLDRLYEYFHHLLVQANLNKQIKPIEECVALMTEMRDTWHEAFALAQGQSSSAPKYNPHGAAAVNVQG